MLRPSALCFALLATPAFAEPGGAAFLDLAGDEHEFPLWVAQSDFAGNAEQAAVNIFAQAGEAAKAQGYGTFTLAFAYRPGEIRNPEASLQAEGPDGPVRLHGSAEAGNLGVTVEHTEINGDELTISGTFSGRFGPSDNFGGTIDMSDPWPVSGRFAVTLGPL